MPSSQLISPKNPTRAFFFSAGSWIAGAGQRLMQLFGDPVPELSPELIALSTPIQEALPEDDGALHLELNFASDPEVLSADPSETIVHQVVLNVTAWRPEARPTPSEVHMRFGAYAEKLIYFDPFMIKIEKGQMAPMEEEVLIVQQEA